MATLAEIRAKIADQINRTDLNTQIDDEINKAIKHYSAQRFWFAETQTTFPLVVGQQSYGTADSVPSTLLEIIKLKVTVSGTYYDVTPKPFDYIEERNKTNIQDIPEYYAYFQSKIYFYPLPNSAYTATLSYFENYADITTDAGTKDFTTNAVELITQRAKKSVLLNYVKDDEDAKRAELLESAAFNALTAENDRRKATNMILPSQF
jgi:hypothetical protein